MVCALSSWHGTTMEAYLRDNQRKNAGTPIIQLNYGFLTPNWEIWYNLSVNLYSDIQIPHSQHQYSNFVQKTQRTLNYTCNHYFEIEHTAMVKGQRSQPTWRPFPGVRPWTSFTHARNFCTLTSRKLYIYNTWPMAARGFPVQISPSSDGVDATVTTREQVRGVDASDY